MIQYRVKSSSGCNITDVWSDCLPSKGDRITIKHEDRDRSDIDYRVLFVQHITGLGQTIFNVIVE